MKKETKTCPFCGEEILAVAKKCKHCHEMLDTKESPGSQINKDVLVDEAKAKILAEQEAASVIAKEQRSIKTSRAKSFMILFSLIVGPATLLFGNIVHLGIALRISTPQINWSYIAYKLQHTASIPALIIIGTLIYGMSAYLFIKQKGNFIIKVLYILGVTYVLKLANLVILESLNVEFQMLHEWQFLGSYLAVTIASILSLALFPVIGKTEYWGKLLRSRDISEVLRTFMAETRMASKLMQKFKSKTRIFVQTTTGIILITMITTLINSYLGWNNHNYEGFFILVYPAILALVANIGLLRDKNLFLT